MTAPNVVSSKKFINGDGVVDSSGNCEIDFPPTPAGMYWTGTVTVYSSPSGIQWNININSQQFDVAFGQQSIGGVQIGGGDKLTVTATQLNAYIGTTFNATFAVIETPELSTQLTVPGHDALNQLSGYARTIVNTHITVADNTVTFPLAPTDRALIVLCYPSQPGDSVTAAVTQVQGNLTGVDYLAASVPTLTVAGVASAIAGPVLIPVLGSIETEGATLEVINAGAGTQVVVIATPDPFLYNDQEPTTVLMDSAQQSSIYGPIPVTGTITGTVAVQEAGPAHGDSVVTVNAPAGTTIMLATPAAGTGYWVKSALIQAPTAAAGLTLLRIQTATSNVMLVAAYAGADGCSAQASFTDMVITEGIELANALAVNAGGHLVYKLVNIT